MGVAKVSEIDEKVVFIFYGSEPTESSPIHTPSAPLVLTATTAIKARGFKREPHHKVASSLIFPSIPVNAENGWGVSACVAPWLRSAGRAHG